MILFLYLSIKQGRNLYFSTIQKLCNLKLILPTTTECKLHWTERNLTCHNQSPNKSNEWNISECVPPQLHLIVNQSEQSFRVNET
jgi:hypothetical protein